MSEIPLETTGSDASSGWVCPISVDGLPSFWIASFGNLVSALTFGSRGAALKEVDLMRASMGGYKTLGPPLDVTTWLTETVTWLDIPEGFIAIRIVHRLGIYGKPGHILTHVLIGNVVKQAIIYSNEDDLISAMNSNVLGL